MAEAREGQTESSFGPLISAARAGCSRSIGALVERSRPFLLATARRQLRGRPTAGDGPSDVVQQASIVVGRKIAGFEGEGERGFRAWLGRIVALTARNVARRGRLRAGSPLDLDGSRLVDPGTSPSSRAGRDEESARLAEALALLTEDDRRLLTWHAIEGRSFAEIGRRIGKSDVSARADCKRALARLDRALKRPEPPGGAG